MDQAESSTTEIPLTFSGRNDNKKIFVISLFVDSISERVFCELQHSTGASETIELKRSMECECMQYNVKLKAFRGDNGVYKAAGFRAELSKNYQRVTYCGSGAYHQNGIAKRYIRTMVEKARTVLLNAHTRWPKSIDIELWIFSFRYVATQ